MRHFVNISLLFFFLTLCVTGVLSFFAPFSLVTTRVHVLFGFGTLVLVGLHLAFRTQYFVRGLRPAKGKKRFVPGRTIAWVVGVWAFLLTASLWDWPPATQIIGIGYEARNRAAIFRPDPKTAYQRLGEEMRLKRDGEVDSGLLVELEWGPAFPARYKRGPGPFDSGRPQIAIWAETDRESLIETLFVSQEAAFSEQFEWGGNRQNRADILPVWRHRYTLKTGIAPDGEVAVYSGATPDHSFSLHRYLKTDAKAFYLYVEVNAPRNPNAYFNPEKDPDEPGYVNPGLGQPSVIYGAYLTPEEEGKYALLDLVAHGGSANTRDGNMHYDLDRLTTAKRLVEKILVRVVRSESEEALTPSIAAEGNNP